MSGDLGHWFVRYSCKGLKGQNVDWFIIYKLPKGEKGAVSGKEFLYLDSEDANWAQSRKTIDSPDVGLGATISQLYRDEKSAFHFLYSDDSPIGKADSYRGHAKGVVLFDSQTGFWIVHSIPNYPDPNGKYSYPETAVKYAQSAICVTVSTDNLGDIGEHLRYIQATPYSTNLPSSFDSRFPVLKNIIAKKSLPSSATQFVHQKYTKTVNGMTFYMVAKYKKLHQDLWHDVIAQELKANLAVQSWLNGNADDLHTTCSGQYYVYDMQTVTIPGLTFNSSKDHSKWAVSDTEKAPIVCIGDLNRQKSQLKRGGGAICLNNQYVWKSYRTTVNLVEPCRTNRGRYDFRIDTQTICPFVFALVVLLKFTNF
ncbi:hypothetical protein WR25_13315 [Diploscapter pachys]|uniref:Uncharacterized protein n=1 Tax=Diploscapter pachys TaxID=2018661 RepID=A0A2A2LBX6_9BILA|nr:hypothetical protein WR25_13315 [Diploscapter pachys]